MATDRTTEPCPEDQAAPLAPVRSDLAALALRAGIAAEDVRAFVAGRYSFTNLPQESL